LNTVNFRCQAVNLRQFRGAEFTGFSAAKAFNHTGFYQRAKDEMHALNRDFKRFCKLFNKLSLIPFLFYPKK